MQGGDVPRECRKPNLGGASHSFRTDARAQPSSEQQEDIVINAVDAPGQSKSTRSSSLSSLSQRRVGRRTTHASSSRRSSHSALSSSHMDMGTYPTDSAFPDEGPAVPLWSVYNGVGWGWDSPLRFGSNEPLALFAPYIPGGDQIHERQRDAIHYLEGWTWNFIQLGRTQLSNSASQSLQNLTLDTWRVGIGSQFQLIADLYSAH
jgi:hypothetical protein